MPSLSPLKKKKRESERVDGNAGESDRPTQRGGDTNHPLDGNLEGE